MCKGLCIRGSPRSRGQTPRSVGRRLLTPPRQKMAVLHEHDAGATGPAATPTVAPPSAFSQSEQSRQHLLQVDERVDPQALARSYHRVQHRRRSVSSLAAEHPLVVAAQSDGPPRRER
jgi:hypothetical protein